MNPESETQDRESQLEQDRLDALDREQMATGRRIYDYMHHLVQRSGRTDVRVDQFERNGSSYSIFIGQFDPASWGTVLNYRGHLIAQIGVRVTSAELSCIHVLRNAYGTPEIYGTSDTEIAEMLKITGSQVQKVISQISQNT